LKIEVVPAELEHQTLLENISQFYLYEMSMYVRYIELLENGLFGQLSYWHEPNHHPFLIRVDDKWVGFALVLSFSDKTYDFDMGDFFVLRKYQGHGVGTTASRQLFDRFPGKWRVHQTPLNYPAQAFWQSIISKYTHDNYTQEYDGRNPVILFDNSRC